MVEWRDEYTRKSGHTPDKVAQSRTEKNRTEKREIKDEGALSECLKAGAQGRRAPPDFEVTKVLQEWAATNCPSVAIEKETAKFKNWEFKTPCSDWAARWKIWIQWATDYRERNDGTSDLPNDTEELVKLGELLGIKKRSGESEAQYRKRVFEANQRRIENL